MTFENALFEVLCELGDLMQEKNARYGRNLPRHGLRGIVTRMVDKTMRLEHLVLGKALPTKDESVNDTLRDTAGYAIMALVLDKMNDLTIEGDWKPDTTKDDITLWNELISRAQAPTAPSARGTASNTSPQS